MWEVTETDYGSYVIPLNDPPGHNTESEACLCNPRIERMKNGKMVVVHMAWDNRQFYEEKGQKS